MGRRCCPLQIPRNTPSARSGAIPTPSALHSPPRALLGRQRLLPARLCAFPRSNCLAGPMPYPQRTHRPHLCIVTKVTTHSHHKPAIAAHPTNPAYNPIGPARSPNGSTNGGQHLSKGGQLPTKDPLLLTKGVNH